MAKTLEQRFQDITPLAKHTPAIANFIAHSDDINNIHPRAQARPEALKGYQLLWETMLYTNTQLLLLIENNTDYDRDKLKKLMIDINTVYYSPYKIKDLKTDILNQMHEWLSNFSPNEKLKDSQKKLLKTASLLFYNLKSLGFPYSTAITDKDHQALDELLVLASKRFNEVAKLPSDDLRDTIELAIKHCQAQIAAAKNLPGELKTIIQRLEPLHAAIKQNGDSVMTQFWLSYQDKPRFDALLKALCLDEKEQQTWHYAWQRFSAKSKGWLGLTQINYAFFAKNINHETLTNSLDHALAIHIKALAPNTTALFPELSMNLLERKLGALRILKQQIIPIESIECILQPLRPIDISAIKKQVKHADDKNNHSVYQLTQQQKKLTQAEKQTRAYCDQLSMIKENYQQLYSAIHTLEKAPPWSLYLSQLSTKLCTQLVIVNPKPLAPIHPDELATQIQITQAKARQFGEQVSALLDTLNKWLNPKHQQVITDIANHLKKTPDHLSKRLSSSYRDLRIAINAIITNDAVNPTMRLNMLQTLLNQFFEKNKSNSRGEKAAIEFFSHKPWHLLHLRLGNVPALAKEDTKEAPACAAGLSTNGK